MKQKKGVHKFDWMILGIISLICVTIFGHSDILATANHSLAYLGWYSGEDKGFIDNLIHFYSNAKSFLGSNGVNYLPSTFIVFAVWNLPIKLLFQGILPETAGDYSTLFILWNKGLPVLVFIISCFVLYTICMKDFAFEQEKSMITVFAFASSGIAFLSQFLFCQYDIFTVFFMLMGIHFFFKNMDTGKKGDYWLFMLFFAFAVSFKYFVLFIFEVLILIKEKNVIKIAMNSLIGCLIALFEIGFYLVFDSENFKRGVFGFPVLTYANMSDGVNVGFATIKIFPLVCCIFFLIIYRIRPEKKEDYIKSFIWGSCLICLALFGFMAWHPQWLLFAVPFWGLAMATNHEWDFLIYIDIFMEVIFVGYVVNVWMNNVDQNLYKYGIFMDLFRYRRSLSKNEAMARFFPIDPDILYTVLVALMAAYCIWSCPWLNKGSDTDIDYGKCMKLLRVRFLIGVSVFVLPAVLCIPNLIQKDELAWSGWQTTPECRYATESLLENENVVIQKLTGIAGVVTEMDVYTVIDNVNIADANFLVEIVEENTGVTMAVADVNNAVENCQYTSCCFKGGKPLDQNKDYLVVFRANRDAGVRLACVEFQEGNVIINANAKKREHELDGVVHNNRWIAGATLQMNVYTSGK